MQIIGHGVDLVETAQIQRVLGSHGQRFLDRCYTAAEQAYAADRARRVEHLAVRFAAKEAVFKALGTGWSGGVSWTDVEVVREAGGRPGVALCGVAAEVAQRLGVQGWWLSLSHVASCAMASAIAVGRGSADMMD